MNVFEFQFGIQKVLGTYYYTTLKLAIGWSLFKYHRNQTVSQNRTENSMKPKKCGPIQSKEILKPN